MHTNATFAHLASYNQWMNRKLYEAASGLSEEELHRNRGAFFGSVFGTLNHIAIGDILWFKRISSLLPGLASLHCMDQLPQPAFPATPLCGNLAGLGALRATLDEAIIAFCAEVDSSQLGETLEWSSRNGFKGRKVLGDVLLHVFNHQTHHRGQASTLFSQLSIDIGATDLVLLLPDAP
ncbi:hypothetical protein SRABI118_00842 [Massilia sp. Bi118]|uniref:DinB family protein n=1 Tax=Massilia sp. Bi118 TaxID=2822346 RepID=UPI001E02CB8C|nr:DinB family protein [Massilia sp. Bi118]CAH0164453.1 hypothetical protein SRABI118_00842 [Massilia sp. Bi118]